MAIPLFLLEETIPSLLRLGGSMRDTSLNSPTSELQLWSCGPRQVKQNPFGDFYIAEVGT